MKILALSLLILLIFSLCNAQKWNSAIGISGKLVSTVINYNSDTLLAGVDKNGIYISYDKGIHWAQFALQGETVHSLIKVNRSIIAGTYLHDIFTAGSINSNWNKVIINNLDIYALKIYSDVVYACTVSASGPAAVYASSDIGKTWQKFGATPPYAFLDIDFNSDGRAFVATPFGAYYSDNQSPWILTGGPTVWNVICIGKDSILYGTADGIYLSKDNGVTMRALESIESTLNAGRTFCFNDTIYVNTGFDIMYTADISKQWKSLNFSLGDNFKTMNKIENKIFVGTNSGMYYCNLDSVNHNDTTINEPNDTTIYINHFNRNAITIYPNPTTGIFEIQGVESDDIIIDIYNLAGQKVLKSKSVVNDISSLKSGLYFIKIKKRNIIVIRKLIKE
jgi:photosystem II stability/assembly factor-like uncharacterized protein